VIGIPIQIEGQEAVARAFVSLDAFFQPERLWPTAAEVSREYAAERFAAEGPGWPGLSEAYAARKQAKHGAQKILHAEGKYEASLTLEGAEFSIYEPESDGVTVGSSHPAALAHEEGVDEIGLPARPVFGDLEALAGRVTARMERDLTEHARDLGLAA
jgi:Phage virion morphogenesis family